MGGRATMTGCGADRAAADRPRRCAGPSAPPPGDALGPGAVLGQGAARPAAPPSTPRPQTYGGLCLSPLRACWACAWLCPRPEHVSALPSLLGVHGCLARARCACDPATETFSCSPASPVGSASEAHQWRHGAGGPPPCGAGLRALSGRPIPALIPPSSTGHTASRTPPAGAPAAVGRPQYCRSWR